MAMLTAWLGGNPVDPSARAMFPDLLVAFGEGSVTYAYPDNLGNITTGRGNELETYADFAALDWRNPDGSVCTANQLQTAWTTLLGAASRVRALGPKAWPGGGRFATLTTIRATKASIDALIQNRLNEFDAALRANWPGWDDAPPPAQEALMRLAWACGTKPPKGVTSGGWPRLHAFWVAKQWGSPGCADECAIPALDGTEPTANATERDLFLAAALGGDGMATGTTDPAPAPQPDDT